jgi:hypothetical protein
MNPLHELSDSELSEYELSENTPLYNLESLIRHRNRFEDYIYDYLVTANEIPESFWEPVTVCLSDKQIDLIKTIECEEIECFICKDNKNLYKKLTCCDNKICLDCTNIWFNKSVFCPFCKKDQRTILDN